MDKLQPILKHHFWILAFLVLPLGIWGYYTANSSLNAATQAREDALNGVYDNIPQGTSPNKSWETEMKALADEYEQEVNTVISTLHQDQEALMDWPPLMAPFEPAEYRGAWDGDRHFAYKDAYPDLVEDVWRRYQPVVTDLPEGADRSWITWDEKVIIARDAILPVHEFGNLRATDEQIWDAQEDIWLHRIIADAVVRTNEDADGPYTAIVKLVQQVELMGGDGKPVAAGGGQGAQSGQSGQNSGARDGMDSYMDQFGGGRGGRRGATQSSVAFDPAEEIGAGGRMSGSRGRMEGAGGNAPPAATGQSGDNSTVLRYVGSGQNDKSSVRAFYMSVIVDQSKFPEFLVELCNSEWPIEIVRFNIGPNPYASQQGSGRGAGGGGYGSGSYGPSGGPMGNRPPMGGIGGRPTGGMPPTGGPMGLNRPMGGPMGGPMGIGVDSVGRRQDHESFGALESSKLVQLDLLGLITIFTPPENPVVAAASTGSEEQTEEEVAADSESEDAATDDETTPVEDSTASSDVETDATDVEVEAAEGQEEVTPDQSAETDDSEGALDPAAASESEAIPESDEIPATEASAGVE